MSVVLVTGGTGALGRLVVERLRAAGSEVRVLTRRVGRGTHLGDLTSGAGVAEAARGAEVIVHAASDTYRFGRTDLAQTEHLLEHAGAARHLLYVSIVGIDRIPFPYYRRKLECERRIAASGIPYTVLRATQFHELVAEVLHRVGGLPIAPLPLDFRFQTVAAVRRGRVRGRAGARRAGAARAELRRPGSAEPGRDGRRVAGRPRTPAACGAPAAAGRGGARVPRGPQHVPGRAVRPADVG